MIIAIFVVSTAAAALAWVVARRRLEHRPIAMLLSAGLAFNAALLALNVAVLAPMRERFGMAAPWTGCARAAGHLADALELAWPASVVATALVVFAGRKPWPAFLGWAALVAAMVATHPTAADGSLGRVLTAAALFSAIVSAGLFVAWYRRPRKPTTSAHYALAMIVAIELASLVAAWRVGPFEHWDLSQVVYMVLFVALVALQGRLVWTTYRTA